MSAQAAPYALIGGEAAVRALTRRFYALMDELPEAAACRAIHPADLAGSEAKLLRLPHRLARRSPVYVQKNGRPMLRARHLHAPIGPDEIEGWLACFRQAWAKTSTIPP